MIDIYFYNITKRLNSTARPVGTGDKYECLFKENTSLLTPVLTLRLSSKPDYNYFKIDNRYYWITEIVSLNNDRWQITGRVDPLGSLKGHIQATSAFVLFDSTPNTQLPDNRLAIETDVKTYTASATMPWHFSDGNGTCFICTTGDPASFDWQTFVTTPNAKAGTGVYIIPRSSIDQLGFDASDMTTSIQTFDQQWQTASSNDLAILNTTSTDFLECIWYTIKGAGLLITDFFKLGFNSIKLLAQNLIGGGDALKNVKASYWIPFTVPASAYVDVNKPLALGTYTDYITGLKQVTDPIISFGTFVNIPWHYNDWRNTTCTEVSLYIPLVGCINIPSEVIKGNTILNVKFSVNLYSGSMAVQVSCDGGTIGTYGADTAMPILIGDSNINFGAITNTIIAGASSNVAGMAGGLGMALNPMTSSVGGIGGGAGTELSKDIICTCRVHETSQDPADLLPVIGTPTHQLKTLSGSGFCQCMNAQLNCGSISGEPDPTQTEIELVNNYLNSGVYLE